MIELVTRFLGKTRVNRAVLYVFLSIDLLLIAVYLILTQLIRKDIISDISPALYALFDIEKDWSLGEISNYIKWATLAGIFFCAYRRTHDRLMLALAGVALILLLDDSLQFHERGGAALMSALGVERVTQALAPNLAAMVIWAILGALGSAAILMCWRRSDPDLRARVIPMIWIMCGIVFAGIVVDTANFMMPRSSIRILTGVLEDGGEMIGATLMVAYAWGAFGPIRASAR